MEKLKLVKVGILGLFLAVFCCFGCTKVGAVTPEKLLAALDLIDKSASLEYPECVAICEEILNSEKAAIDPELIEHLKELAGKLKQNERERIARGFNFLPIVREIFGDCSHDSYLDRGFGREEQVDSSGLESTARDRLRNALEHDDVELLKEVLAEKYTPDTILSRDDWNYFKDKFDRAYLVSEVNLLDLAVVFGAENCVRYCFTFGNSKDTRNVLPLAIASDNPTVVRIAMELIEEKVPVEAGKTAVEHRDPEIVRYLLSSKKGGFSPEELARLAFFAIHLGLLDRPIIEVICNKMASEVPDLAFFEFLENTSDSEVVKGLLTLDWKDPDALRKHKEEKLFSVCREEDLKMVEVLLASGTDVKATQGYGSFTVCSAIHSAVENNEGTEVVVSLLGHGADVNERDCYGRTPLNLAASFAKPRIVKVLLEHEADVSARDHSGRTPLHSAACMGGPETLRLLLAQGSDVNVKDNNGSTPLHKAVQHNNLEIVEILLKYGADVNARDHSGRTPMGLAHVTNFYHRNPNPRIFRALQAHGATE